MMAAVRRADTAPELYVRRELFAAGFRYRLNARKLPGRPDIVLPRYKTVVFVHGCFWHGHACARGKRPQSNAEFWNAKIDGNMRRDRRMSYRAQERRLALHRRLAVPSEKGHRVLAEKSGSREAYRRQARTKSLTLTDRAKYAE